MDETIYRVESHETRNLLKKFKGTLSIETMRLKKKRHTTQTNHRLAVPKPLKRIYYNGRQDEFFIRLD